MRQLFIVLFLLLFCCSSIFASSKTFKGSGICEDASIIFITTRDNMGDRFFGAEPPFLHYIELGTYDYTDNLRPNYIHMLIRFKDYEDSIPTSQQIDSAFLKMYYFQHLQVSSPQASEYAYIYKLLCDWNEGDNNGSIGQQGESEWWFRFRPYNQNDTTCVSSGDSCWSGGGASGAGDRVTSKTDSVLIDSGTYGWKRWNVTADVRSHYSGASVNHGWTLIKRNETTANIRWMFYSSEETETYPDSIPMLIVYYSKQIAFVDTFGSDVCTDAFIYSDTSNRYKNYGTDGVYMECGTWDTTEVVGGRARLLIKFNYGDVFSNYRHISVDSAFIYLNFDSPSQTGKNLSGAYVIPYALLGGWGEGNNWDVTADQGECSAIFAKSPYSGDSLDCPLGDSCWGYLNADSIGVDREGVAFESTWVDSGAQNNPYRFKVTQLVQKHINRQANYGFIFIRGHETSGNLLWKVWDRGAETVSDRPYMIVFWTILESGYRLRRSRLCN